MVQRHSVVIQRDDGGVEVHPLKEWLRQHPDVVPLDPSNVTSHQLRNALRQLGWKMETTPDEVRLIKPGASADRVAAVLGSETSDDGSDDDAAVFALEYQLRDFLAANLSTIPINGKRLKLYIDPTGRDGVEYPTAVGPIDILGVDEAGDFFVFELKRANSADRAIGQVARYMGWISQTIGKEKKVSGVIVARSISENLRYAATVVPNISLFEYEVSFRLQAAHELDRG